MNYLLMNKDDKLLSFRTEPGTLGTTVTETASYCDRRPHGWEGIENWIDARNCAKHKEQFRYMLKDWQLDTPDGFLQVSQALSLNDTLWVKPESSVQRWADVSLYANQFDDIAVKTAFETGRRGIQLSSTYRQRVLSLPLRAHTQSAGAKNWRASSCTRRDQQVSRTRGWNRKEIKNNI